MGTKVARHDCPSQDIVFGVHTPFGGINSAMRKGFLNKEFEGENWVTLRKHIENMKKAREEAEQLERERNGI
jgi:hypothetical protein